MQVEIPAQTAVNGKAFVANLAVENDNRLTKIVTMGNRECAYCNQNYDYRHAKQKYCCDECRIEAWQLRTGSAVRKGRVTGSSADA
jgi:Zn finger protein HypA/HybF involved in hydrogenase expression